MTGEAFVAPAPPKPTELPPKPNAFLCGSAAAELFPEPLDPQSTFGTNIELVAAAPVPALLFNFVGLLVGRQVSDYLAERFPIEIKKELMKNPADLTQPITDVFNRINNELRLIDSDGCGSTACVALVRKEGA